jgi:hypothetical protein
MSLTPTTFSEHQQTLRYGSIELESINEPSTNRFHSPCRPARMMRYPHDALMRLVLETSLCR